MEWIDQTKVWINAHRKYKPLVFFLAGFLFDILTLGRIDQWGTLVQQGSFLLLLGFLLLVESFYPHLPPKKLPEWAQKHWHHRIEVIHFLFGSLLSAYTIFYIKSASLFTSFIFILFLALVMVINELPRFRRTDLSFKFVLYALCVLSFFAYLIPTLIGQVGFWVFILSIFSTLGFIFGLFAFFKKKQATPEFVYKRFLFPSLATVLVFFTFYLLQWIPPVPLSTEYMGIYHNIEKQNGNYLLYHERPFWKVWHNGDQHFKARPGDQIYAFAKIFSPTGFKDQVVFHWLKKDKQQGWQTMDKIPIEVIGGRDEGFRGYAVKGRYDPGSWRVQVETLDGREIGRIYLTVTKASAEKTIAWKVDQH